MPVVHLHTNPRYQQPNRGIALLIEEIDRLIANHDMVLREEGIDRQLDNLKAWLETHQHQFSTAPRLSETGYAWLSDICDSLKFAARKRRMLKPSGDIDIERSKQITGTIERLERILVDDAMTPIYSTTKQ